MKREHTGWEASVRAGTESSWPPAKSEPGAGHAPATPTSGGIPKRSTRPWTWLLVGIVMGAIMGTNPFFQLHIALGLGFGAWGIDMLLALMFSARRAMAWLGVLVSGLFLSVPGMVDSSPLGRGWLMCCMGLPVVMAMVALLAPPTANFQARWAFVCSWGGTKKLEWRERRLNGSSLLVFMAASLVFAVALGEIKIHPGPVFRPICWLSGGILMLAFAEMLTASHDCLTSLLGISSPALMRSPVLSTSISEFWSRRWNPGASVLFRTLCFTPLARHGVGLAMFAAFFASAMAHVLLFYLAIAQWRASLICGAFFLVQPLIIAAERRLNVRHWRPVAGRTWTISMLAITSPLFVSPGLEILERSWGPMETLARGVMLAAAFVVIINALLVFGSLAALRGSGPAAIQAKESATAN